MIKRTIDVDLLKSKLSYNEVTGIFTWNVGERHAGKVAGSISCGYIQISIKGERYLGHRLAWAFVHGKFPDSQVDHINRIRTDNRIINLRESTQAENLQNVGLRTNNKSGYMGVDFHKFTNRYQARICVGGKRKMLGYFDTPEEAGYAYIQAKKILHTFQPTIVTTD